MNDFCALDFLAKLSKASGLCVLCTKINVPWFYKAIQLLSRLITRCGPIKLLLLLNYDKKYFFYFPNLLHYFSILKYFYFNPHDLIKILLALLRYSTSFCPTFTCPCTCPAPHERGYYEYLNFKIMLSILSPLLTGAATCNLSHISVHR